MWSESGNYSPLYRVSPRSLSASRLRSGSNTRRVLIRVGSRCRLWEHQSQLTSICDSDCRNVDLQTLPTSSGPDILIAGCGTGQHSIETARQFKGARVLAIDLSLTSLCYAKRKTKELGVKNIEYGQADVLQLQAIGRTFDIIEASGVLHHLADPLAGWRVLLSILRPGGFMKLRSLQQTGTTELAPARTYAQRSGVCASRRECRRLEHSSWSRCRSRR